MKTFFRDRFTVWFVSGIAGSALKDAFGLFTLWIGFSNYHIVQVAADIFLDKPHLGMVGGILIGIVADFSMGGLFGLAIGALLEWQGFDNHLLKGAVIALGVWMLLIGIIMHSLTQVFDLTLRQPNDIANSMICHLLFGISVAYFIVRLTHWVQRG